MFKVLGVDSLGKDYLNGYFGDPVVERRIEQCAGTRAA